MVDFEYRGFCIVEILTIFYCYYCYNNNYYITIIIIKFA